MRSPIFFSTRKLVSSVFPRVVSHLVGQSALLNPPSSEGRVFYWCMDSTMVFAGAGAMRSLSPNLHPSSQWGHIIVFRHFVSSSGFTGFTMFFVQIFGLAAVASRSLFWFCFRIFFHPILIINFCHKLQNVNFFLFFPTIFSFRLPQLKFLGGKNNLEMWS